MEHRNIQNGSFGWYEKSAMQKIETLPRRQQASCKLIYIAICSASAKQKNSPNIECYKFDIARFASVDEKTVQRYLPVLEKLDIISVSPQDRLSDGRYGKIIIWLKLNKFTVGQLQESSEKVRRKFVDTESDIYKEKKERKKESIPPKKEAVISFFQEKLQSKTEAEKFYNFYDSKNWMVGKNKMTKWKSAASGWISRNNPPEKIKLTPEQTKQVKEAMQGKREWTPELKTWKEIHLANYG